MVSLFFIHQSLGIPVGIIDAKRRFRCRIHHILDQCIRILRPLDQDTIRLILHDHLTQMKCAGRAVMPQRKIKTVSLQIAGSLS